MLMFLDSHDTLYTPEKFFFQTLQLHYWGSPGPLYASLLKAFWGFLYILLFLMFVFVVVMAFGDTYEVSSTNRLLATVAGGLVPFLYKTLIATGAGDKLDTESVQFQTELREVIEGFKQTWPVSDIGGTKPGTKKKLATGKGAPRKWFYFAKKAAEGIEDEIDQKKQEENVQTVNEDVTFTRVDDSGENNMTFIINLKHFLSQQGIEQVNTKRLGSGGTDEEKARCL